jgi:hypothetical protein
MFGCLRLMNFITRGDTSLESPAERGYTPLDTPKR